MLGTRLGSRVTRDNTTQEDTNHSQNSSIWWNRSGRELRAGELRRTETRKDPRSSAVMLSPRLPVLSALLVLLLPAGRCAAAAALRGSGSRSDARLDAPSTSTEPPAVTEHGAKAPERHSRSHHGAEGSHRDPQNKEKFIKHLTGPLYFSPKCRKNFYRLYHTTRDCTIPAYYKRCARLLTRLASSPRCAER